MNNATTNQDREFRVIVSTWHKGIISVSDVMPEANARDLARVIREANSKSVRVEVEEVI